MKHALIAILAGGALAACGAPEQATGDQAVEDAATGDAVPEIVATEDVATASETTVLKLLAFDCGRIEISETGVFANDGSYAGRQDVLENGCFVVQHPSGTLLWDTGLPAALVGQGSSTSGVFTASLETSLSDQLAAAGIDKIDYVSISHSHFDHIGQPEAAGAAKWLVHADEYAFMTDPEAPARIEQSAALRTLEREEFTGDRDVFGDGSVMILSMPGHTPGHTVLLVKLAQTGPVLLTGDLYHFAESRTGRKVPVFNTDADQTLAAMDRFEALAESHGARVIIQHSPEDLAALPTAPLGLE